MKTLLQSKWNSAIAYSCFGRISPKIPRNQASDCVINTFAGLGYLSIDKADELARIQNESGSSGISIERHLEFIENIINADITMEPIKIIPRKYNFNPEEIEFLNKFNLNPYEIEYLINKLKSNLNNGNGTLMSYSRANNTGHTITIHRMNDTILYYDIQQNKEAPLYQLFNSDNINNVWLYYESPNKNRMNVDVELDKLVPPNMMEEGGRKKKNKNKMNKNKTNKKKTNKNKTNKKKTKMKTNKKKN